MYLELMHYYVECGNLFVNGAILDSHDFSGGKETNDFLMDRGFEISSIEGILKENDVQKHVVNKIKNKVVDSKVKVPVTVKPLIGEQSIKIATVIIESPETKQPTNKERQTLLGNIIEKIGESTFVLPILAPPDHNQSGGVWHLANKSNHSEEIVFI